MYIVGYGILFRLKLLRLFKQHLSLMKDAYTIYSSSSRSMAIHVEEMRS